MEEKTKLQNYLQKYEDLNGSNCYEIYFIIKHELFKIELKKLEKDLVRIARESSKKGNYEKLRLYIPSSKKQEWLKSGKVRKVGTEEKLLNIMRKNKLNKGQACEYISTKARKQDYKLDSTRFDKAGDVNLKIKKIQVKFENASLTQLRTIDKVAKLNA